MGVLTWGQLRLQIQQSAPGSSFDQVDGWLNRRYQRILDHTRWSWLEGSGFLATLAAVYNIDGTESMGATNGSTSVTGTGTSWTSALTGRQVRIAGTGPLYTFTYVSATAGTLDRAYEGETDTGLAFAFYQNVYGLPAAAKAVRVIEGIYGPLTPLNELDLAVQGSYRTTTGEPLAYDTRPNSTDTGWSVELYPVPTEAKSYPVLYDRIADAFDPASNIASTPLPYVSDSVLLNGALADAHAQLGNEGKRNYYEGQFGADLMTLVRADQLKQAKRPVRMAQRFTRHRRNRLSR